jgi:uncharacterized membrane protein YozB (DUF420 family)
MSTTSLVVELVALGLLIFGYNFKRHSKYRQHGIAMAVAVVLHLLTIFSWMIWSFLSLFSGTSIDFFNPLILATLAHVTLGIIAASLGVWLVASWHLQANVQKCFGRKRIMLATITLWFTAIALGIILYIAVVLS